MNFRGFSNAGGSNKILFFERVVDRTLPSFYNPRAIANMQKTLIKLLRLQILLLAVFASIVFLFVDKHEMVAALAGGMMAVTATLAAMLVFRRLPRIMSAKIFYRGMIVCEICKWGVVMVLGSVFVRHHPPLWVLLGFVAVYSAYFWIMLFDRG